MPALSAVEVREADPRVAQQNRIKKMMKYKNKSAANDASTLLANLLPASAMARRPSGTEVFEVHTAVPLTKREFVQRGPPPPSAHSAAPPKIPKVIKEGGHIIISPVSANATVSDFASFSLSSSFSSPGGLSNMASVVGSTVSNGSDMVFPDVTTTLMSTRALTPTTAGAPTATDEIQLVIREVEEKLRPSFRRREPEEVYGSASYLKEAAVSG